jgi:hypothetical protein
MKIKVRELSNGARIGIKVYLGRNDFLVIMVGNLKVSRCTIPISSKRSNSC